MINPCKDCTMRHINCHAECEKYIEAKQRHEERQEIMRKSRMEAYNTYTLKRAKVRKRKKK